MPPEKVIAACSTHLVHDGHHTVRTYVNPLLGVVASYGTANV